MAQIENTHLTEKNLDRLADFLRRGQENLTLAGQLPDGAHIFHGAYDDADFTRANVNLASKIALGMALGYVDEAPLIMVFENEHGEYIVLNLSTAVFREQSHNLIESYQKQSHRKVASQLHLGT
jgi:hypothetical protein